MVNLLFSRGNVSKGCYYYMVTGFYVERTILSKKQIKYIRKIGCNNSVKVTRIFWVKFSIYLATTGNIATHAYKITLTLYRVVEGMEESSAW